MEGKQMRSVQDYINQAQKISGAPSRNKLANLLGISTAAIAHLYSGKALPSDETMEKIAVIAGIDPELALIELNIMRSNGKAKSAYENVLKRLNNIAVSILAFVASLFMIATPANAAATKPLIDICCTNTTVVYITENCYVNKLKRFLNNILSILFNDLQRKTN
jgi:transcriptional regulator with XRE-family HTH domain